MCIPVGHAVNLMDLVFMQAYMSWGNITEFCMPVSSIACGENYRKLSTGRHIVYG